MGPTLSQPTDCMLVAQACLTLCNHMDCSPQGSSVYGILQAGILEELAIPFFRGSFRLRIKPRSHKLQADSLPAEPQQKLKNTGVGSLSLLQWIFPTQELNLGLLHCRQILYQQSYKIHIYLFTQYMCGYIYF